MFEPVVTPGGEYNKWDDLGPLQQGIFNLYITNSPRAHILKSGDSELQKHRLDFPADPSGAHLFIRAVKPHVLELAAVLKIADLTNEGLVIKTFPLT